ncbi:ABC transporter permease [Amycolatopsis aidingensis]|uniref:ABC transporter permease n=1 Tax=Amycolatopsis aidingensis TaxID=2842453 RepID=UPI001C0D7716|nr:ABC transporter permease [Amycolatopsis aidingensis]
MSSPVSSRRAGTGSGASVASDWTGSRLPTQVWVLTTRSLRAAFGDYRLVFFGLMQPVVLLLLFSQVFERIGSLPGMAGYDGYLNFLMPATMINIAMIAAMSSGAGLLAETYTGVIGRFRTMPISLFSVLLARTLSDTARLAVQLVATLVAGILVLGFRPGGGPFGVTAAVLLTLVVGWGLGWVFVAMATWLRKAETMQAVSFFAMFPLMFSSSAYMPLEAMPAWIRTVSTLNPLTYAIDATRGLALGRPFGSALLLALALVLVTALLGGTLAVRNFRRNE